MDFIVLDFETTGLSPKSDRIIEIGYTLVTDNVITQVYSQLVNPDIRIVNPKITEITGIDNYMIEGAPPIKGEMEKLHSLIQGKLIVAHNAKFDMGFLNNTFYRMGLKTYHSYLCTANMFRNYKKELNINVERASLAVMTDYFGFVNQKAHRAGADAEVTAKSLLKMCENIEFRNYMEGVPKRTKVVNEHDKPTKTDIYMHYFDTHIPIEIICGEMKVKISTASKYFLNWLSYGDETPYREFIKAKLPTQELVSQILKLKSQGISTSNIHRQLGGGVEYFAIQLVGKLGIKRIETLMGM